MIYRPFLLSFLATASLVCGQEAQPSKAPEPAQPQEVAPKPSSETDLIGSFIQVQTGGLLEFLPGGKLNGFPTGGQYRFVEPGKIEMLARKPDGGEERTPVKIFNTPDGIAMVRNVHGEDEATMLVRLKPAALEPDKWAGPAVIHLLKALDKKAVKRNVTLDKEGYFRTPEGGYYFRLYKGPTGSVLGYSTEQGQPTITLKLFKAGPLLVTYDDLANPKLLAIVQTNAKLDNVKEPAKPVAK
jgi:hypothetical protein